MKNRTLLLAIIHSLFMLLTIYSHYLFVSLVPVSFCIVSLYFYKKIISFAEAVKIILTESLIVGVGLVPLLPHLAQLHEKKEYLQFSGPFNQELFLYILTFYFFLFQLLVGFLTYLLLLFKRPNPLAKLKTTLLNSFRANSTGNLLAISIILFLWPTALVIILSLFQDTVLIVSRYLGICFLGGSILLALFFRETKSLLVKAVVLLTCVFCSLEHAKTQKNEDWKSLFQSIDAECLLLLNSGFVEANYEFLLENKYYSTFFSSPALYYGKNSNLVIAPDKFSEKYPIKSYLRNVNKSLLSDTSCVQIVTRGKKNVTRNYPYDIASTFLAERGFVSITKQPVNYGGVSLEEFRRDHN